VVRDFERVLCWLGIYVHRYVADVKFGDAKHRVINMLSMGKGMKKALLVRPQRGCENYFSQCARFLSRVRRLTDRLRGV
jgi:hypothetical protein